MDGFILILAIIIFSVFKNVMQEAKNKDGGQREPDVFHPGGEQAEAQQRSLEALQRWEAKQRRLPPAEGRERSDDSLRIPRAGEHRTDVRLEPRGRQRQGAQRSSRPMDLAGTTREAERTRREAYDAIRQLLAGQTQTRHAAPSSVPAVREESVPARRGETRVELERETGLERRRNRAPVSRARIKGTLARREAYDLPATREAPAAGSGSGRRVPAATPAGLHRLDALSPVARGVMYAELLGRPIALRDDPGTERD